MEPGKARSAKWEHDPARMHWTGRSEWVRAPQQERSQAGMVAVLESATLLFSQHGFENTTIAMISNDSGTSTAAIYRRFADKNAILRAIVDHWSQAWSNDFNQIWNEPDWSGASPEDLVRFHVEILFSAFRSDPGLLREIDRQCNYHPAVAQSMAAMDQRSADKLTEMLAIASGRPPEQLRPHVDRTVWVVRSAIANAIPREQMRLWPPFTIHDDQFKELLTAMALATLIPVCAPA